MYKCKDCGKQFVGGSRRDKNQVITDYIEGKQTLNQLADKYERSHDRRIKKKTPPYMRPKLRSAYLSIKRNMPLLWTFYDHPELGLPNTNNGLEGVFFRLEDQAEGS